MATKISREDLSRLEELQGEIRERVDEARGLLPKGPERNRAEAYWVAQMRIALDNDHGLLASASTSMQDTIDELRTAGTEEDEE